MRAGFIQLCLAYNECVDWNHKGKATQLVIPAATGSGKTVSAILYLSEIAKMELSGLLVTAEVSAAIKAAETINEITGKDVAGVYYSISDKNPEHRLRHDIKNLPIITIITHSMFVQRSDSEKDIDLLRSFRNKQRDIIIIDERIGLKKTISFGTVEIDVAVSILKRDDKLLEYAEILSDFNESFCKTIVNKVNRNIGDLKIFHDCLANALINLQSIIGSDHYDLSNRLKRADGKTKNPYSDIADLKNLLNRIVYVIAGHFEYTVEGPKVICHREENLSEKFGSVVVLDATSMINPEYEYRFINNHDIVLLNRISSRNYSNVTLNVCSYNNARQSKSAIYSNPKRKNEHIEIIHSYLKMIESILGTNDKMLVTTYKVVASLFAYYSPFKDKVKFIYWGSKEARGSNDFKDFNKALVIGWFRKPTHTYVSSVMAINDFDNYINTAGSVWSDATYLKNMLIVDDMIQFFNRVRCRTAIDKKGNCLPVELYCFTGGNDKMETLIRKSFEREMSNIVINEWEPKALDVLKQKVTRDEERAEIFIDWIKGELEKYDEKFFKDLKKEFSLKSNVISKVIKSDYFMELLEEEGITKTHGKGKGNPVKFILTK